MKEKSAAILTIKRVGDMTLEGRKSIASWLRRHADFIVRHGHKYAPKFTGRYLY